MVGAVSPKGCCHEKVAKWVASDVVKMPPLSPVPAVSEEMYKNTAKKKN